jgi:hypothetical protein
MSTGDTQVPPPIDREKVAEEASTAGNLAHENIQRFLELQALERAGLIMVAHQQAAASAAQAAGLAAQIAALKTRALGETES